MVTITWCYGIFKKEIFIGKSVSDLFRVIQRGPAEHMQGWHSVGIKFI
jgi:hypothetical protein